MKQMRAAPRRTVRSLAGLIVATMAVALSAGAAQATPRPAVDVTSAPYSAAGDGVTNDRLAIQQAIDDASAAGGGTVVLALGRAFLSGNLVLKNGVSLQVDGTLMQSQKVEDYSQPPAVGHYGSNDLANFTNLPLIHAADASGVGVGGSGTIQMTRAAGGLAATIQTAAIGFYKVHDYAIRDVHIDGGHVYNVMLYSTDHGLVQGITIQTPLADPVTGVPEGNTDGISLQNSSNIRITQNSITTDDDAVYVWASYKDPRGGVGSWWSSAAPEPSRNIEIDHNTVRTMRNGRAFSFIPWGATDPDQSEVEISDVNVHDNSFTGGSPWGSALGMWSDLYADPAGWTGSSYGFQSPITRVTFANNTYSGAISPMRITDLKSDFQMLGTGASLNGDFSSGTADWTAAGDAGVATYDTLPPAIGAGEVQSATPGFDGKFGYLFATGDDTTLYQGLGLGAPAPLEGLVANGGAYTVSLQIATGTDPAEIFVQDTCTSKTLASKEVSAPVAQWEQLTFTMAANCQNVRIGARMSAGEHGWAVLDDFDVTPPAMHALDPGNVYNGHWSWSGGNSANEWRGSVMTAASPGQSVTTTFSGVRARVVADRSPNSGIASVSVDGQKAVDVDLYAPDSKAMQVVFDTGKLVAGKHTIRLEPTGRANPAATSTWLTYNSVLIDPSPTTVNRQSLDFGSVAVGTKSGTKLVTVRAYGPDRLRISRITVTGEDPSDFPLVSAGANRCKKGPVAVGDTCTIAVSFAPTADGNRSAVLRITYSSGDVQDVALTGTTPDGFDALQAYSDLIDNKDPRMQLTGGWATYVSPDGGDIGGDHLVGFGVGANAKAVFTGTRIVLRGTTDTNLGQAEILVDGVDAGTANFVSPSTVRHATVFDSGVLPYGEHTFELRTTSGLSVIDALLVYGGIKTEVDRDTLSFGLVTVGSESSGQQVKLTASGVGRAEVGGVRVVGSDAADFVIATDTSNGCTRGSVLKSGESCTVIVQFSPSRAGLRVAALRIADTTDQGYHEIVLRGIGEDG